jgi:hypothetical protein
MNAPTALNPTHVPAPVFTLGSALRWPGHDCPDRCCSETIGDLDAHIEPCNTQAGPRAFGYPRALILKALRRNEFRHLRRVRDRARQR